MKRLIVIVISMFCLTSLLFAQTSQNVTDEGDEQSSEQEQLQEIEDQDITYDMWGEPLYFQFEKMMPRVAKSLGRLDGRISTLAVTDLDFSPTLEPAFRRVASAKLYGQLLIENPRLKLIKCNECNMIRSEIRNGILTVSRGLASQESRQKLASKLDVEGFLSAMIIEEDRQLSIVINVYDAQEGRIILSDVIAGVPVPDTIYYNVYLGLLTVPISVLENSVAGSPKPHTAILLGAERSIRFAESWMVATNIGLYVDNNTTMEEPHQTIQGGLIFDGAIGWEALSFMNNNVSIIGMAGIGEFLSPQFNFSVYAKFGFKSTIGQVLTFNVYYYSLLAGSNNLETPDSTTGEASSLSGSATSITFGYQF